MKFEEIKNILKSKTVGVAGCGGLGSNCAVALARVGIGNLIIVDFDVIEESNLNRQYYFFHQIGKKKSTALKENIKKINPEINVIAIDKKLASESILEIFKDCDVIVEAFDKAEVKHMIIETVLEKFPDKPIVSGIGMAGWGDNSSLKTVQHSNLFICGDQISEASEENPPLAPRVGVVANMQANIVLGILLKL